MVFQSVLKSLFAHLLILCLLSAIAAGVAATVFYHSYRQNVLSDRQAVELSNTAQTMAPLLIRASQNYQRRAVRQFLRIFAAFPYVRCVNLQQNNATIQSWPAPQCSSPKDAEAPPITLPIGPLSEAWQIVVHRDAEVFRHALRMETGIFALVLTAAMLLVFLGVVASIRYVMMQPLDKLKAAMYLATPEKPVLAKQVRDDEIGALVTVYNRLAAASRYYMRQLDRSQNALREREQMLDEINRNLNDSVHYASNIQRALLVDRAEMSKILGKTVVIWQPKDFVGGDFYWFKKIKGRQYLVFFDCTGHGVPGAFMTMVVISIHEQIGIAARRPPEAAKLLAQLHAGVCKALGTSQSEPTSSDGLDCAILAFADDMSGLDFAAASMDLYVVPEKGAVTRLRGSRVSLGYGKNDLTIQDEQHRQEIGTNSFVIASDGMATQIGDETKRAFGNRRFLESLDRVESNDPAKLVRQLARDLNRWQGDQERRDDVTVLAFKPASQ
ncbi:SpoIIE family protein phosphatase [Alphaproteobacteria bacterium]|nr:SpoIIE family protein phosphatase [Alphaproteobacteria bacterium]